MRKCKSYKYKNYGPTPQNEYTTNLGKGADSATSLGVDPQAGDTAHLIKRKAQHPSGRKEIRGWLRSWKVNGWRAESAALHDEACDIGK